MHLCGASAVMSTLVLDSLLLSGYERKVCLSTYTASLMVQSPGASSCCGLTKGGSELLKSFIVANHEARVLVRLPVEVSRSG